MTDHLFGKELFIRFTASAFRKLPSVYVLSYFPFGFEGRMWDLIVSVPDHCLSFYFPYDFHTQPKINFEIKQIDSNRMDILRTNQRSLKNDYSSSSSRL